MKERYGYKIRTTGNSRQETLDGREMLVADVVLLVEGVHAGSAGPIYYPPQTLQLVPDAWNGRPLPVLHPEDTGHGFSANTPQTWEERVVGQLFNVVYTDVPKPSVVGEVWIDVEKCGRVSPETVNAVRNGQPLEVSTGITFWTDGQAGVWNGESHIGTATAYITDHLALLPGFVGACSGRDGCGINNCKPCADRKRKAGGPMKKKPLSFLARLASMKKEVEGQALYEAIQSARVINEMSMDDVREALYNAVAGSYDGGGWSHYVHEVFNDKVIFVAYGSDPASSDGSANKMFSVGYSVNEDGVTLEGDPVEVEQVYATKAEAEPAENVAGEKEAAVMKETLIKALIACNTAPFTERDRETLRRFDDGTLRSICKTHGLDDKGKPIAAAPAGNAEETDEEKEKREKKEKEEAAAKKKADNAAAGNADAPPQRMTMEQFLAILPEDVAAQFQAGNQRESDAKAFLVHEISTNPRNTFNKEQLAGFDLGTLTNIRDMLVPANYGGQAGAFGFAPGENAQRENLSASGGVVPRKVWNLGKK